MAETLSAGTKLLRAPRSRSRAGQTRRHWFKNKTEKTVCMGTKRRALHSPSPAGQKLSVDSGGPKRTKQLWSVRHTEIVSKSTLEKLARDGVKRIRDFQDA